MRGIKEARGAYFLELQALLSSKAGFRGQAGRVEVVVFLATALFQVCLELLPPSPVGGSIISLESKIRWVVRIFIYINTHKHTHSHANTSPFICKNMFWQLRQPIVIFLGDKIITGALKCHYIIVWFFFCQFTHSLYHVLYWNCWAVPHTPLLASGALTCSQLILLMLISTHGWNMDIYSIAWIKSIKISVLLPNIITLFLLKPTKISILNIIYALLRPLQRQEF